MIDTEWFSAKLQVTADMEYLYLNKFYRIPMCGTTICSMLESISKPVVAAADVAPVAAVILDDSETKLFAIMRYRNCCDLLSGVASVLAMILCTSESASGTTTSKVTFGCIRRSVRCI